MEATHHRQRLLATTSLDYDVDRAGVSTVVSMGDNDKQPEKEAQPVPWLWFGCSALLMIVLVAVGVTLFLHYTNSSGVGGAILVIGVFLIFAGLSAAIFVIYCAYTGKWRGDVG